MRSATLIAARHAAINVAVDAPAGTQRFAEGLCEHSAEGRGGKADPPRGRRGSVDEWCAPTAWVVTEHGQLWPDARQLAGLPAAADEPLTVSTPVADPSSLAPAPLQLTTDVVDRTIELAVFAQLPDLSSALWDWASGNEGCPPSGTDGFSECHAFKAHVG
jgi:hypothetical protein